MLVTGAARAQWADYSYHIERVGLYGPGQTDFSGKQFSGLDFLTVDGHAAGQSERFSINGASNGANSWAFDPVAGVTVSTGFTSPAHTGSDGYQYSVNNFQNTAGQIEGYSLRVLGTRTNNGQNTWLYDPATGSMVQTGLTSGVHTGTGAIQYSEYTFQNVVGQAIGISRRYRGSLDNGSSSWVYDLARGQTVPTGLSQPAHFSTNGYYRSENQFHNAAGFVVGTTARIASSQLENGQDVWIYDVASNSCVQLGLTGGVFTGSAGRQLSLATILGANGRVVGDSRRYVGANTLNGSSSWAYEPLSRTSVQIGLTTAAHTGSAGYQTGGSDFLSLDGFVAGHSTRVLGTSTSNGINTWFYDPRTGVTIQTGFNGPANTGLTGYQFSDNDFQSASGSVAGKSFRIKVQNTQDGQSTWYFESATGTLVQTGLTGAPFTGSTGYQYSTNDFMNAAGQVAGTSRFVSGVNSSSGAASWIYEPATQTTVRTGLIDAAHTRAGVQSSQNDIQNEAGVVAGYSSRYTASGLSIGRDAWVYDPATATTVQIGLTGGVFTGADGTQISDAEYLNAGGQVAGTSHRVVGPSADNGTSMWVCDSARMSTVQTGLTDAVHSGSGGYQYSNNTFQDDNGVVMGYSRRYTGVNTQCGEDAWYYDPTTGITTQATGGVPDTVYVATNYAYSKAVAQTDSGFMLGYYRRYPGGVGGDEQRAFIYRPDLGFSDLGALVDGGLAQAGWDKLLSADFGPSADWVGGAGLVAGQNSAGGSQSAFIMRRLIALCPADFNADGAVDFFDYDAFVVAFEVGDPRADFDQDGSVDFFDYDAFVVAFESPC